MASNREPLNRSVELLARGMREVVTDAVTQGMGLLTGQVACIRDHLAGVKEDLAEVREDLAGVKEDLAGVKDEVKVLGVRMDNMESNVQAQLAEHRKQIAANIRRQLSQL